MLDKIYVTIRADKSSGLPAYDDYTFEYIPKFKEAGFVLIKVNNNFSHPDIGVNLRYWVELYHRTSYHYVNQMLLTLYSINWDGNEVFGEKAITPHKTFGAAEYYIERHNAYQYESRMQPLNEYIDDIVTQVNKLPTSSKLHFNRLDKDYGKFFHLFVGGINETDDEIIRTGDYASVHFEYNSNKFCGNEVIKNDNAFFNLSGFVSENDTVGSDDNVEHHFDSFDILFKDNINFKELKFVIRYYSQNNYHSRPTNEPTIRSFTAYQYDSYTAPYVLAAICEPACFAARMFNRTKEAYDFLYKNYFTHFTFQPNIKKIDSFVNCRLTRKRDDDDEASAFLLYNGENFILADVPSKSITGTRSLFLGDDDSVPMCIGLHENVEKLLALDVTHQTGDRYEFIIDYLNDNDELESRHTLLDESYNPSDEWRESENAITAYINFQHFALQQYSEYGLNIFIKHDCVPPYKYYLNEQFKKTATTINLLKEKQIKPIINTMDFIIDVGNKDLFSNLYLNTTPLVQLPAYWNGTKDMIYACDKDGNLVDPKVIFHGEVNTASVSGEEASKPERSKEIVTYEFTPKETLTQICFHLPQEKDMFTTERSHVSYYVVDEIVHTEGDENLCAQFNSGFTEIVKSFERDKTDNEQITDAIRTYCSSDLLPETFSIGRAYIVRREVTYYKYFAPDTITALAELKVQYEKHKEYINSPECNPKPKETSYFIAVPYAVTSNHDVSCYTIPLNSAVLEYHIKTSSIYVNSKYAEYQTAYNKMRNNNIRWKLNKPTSDFEIILEDLNLRDAIINNFQRWLTNTNQVSTPKINSTSRVLNEVAFRISRYFNRIKYSPCGDFKNILHETDIPIVSSSDISLDYGVVPKFEMSVKDIQNGDEVTEENYFIKVEYALKENNPFGVISAKEMFTLEDISSMQIATILLSNYTKYTKTHNEKIVKIKDGVIQSRLDSTPYQLYMHKDTQEMYVQNGEFSFLLAVPFFAEKEEKIMDKQYFDEVDQEDIALTQGKHAVHFAMGNNLLPERWDARDYHFNLAQVAANVATADTLEESRHIKHSKQFNDYFQQYTSKQVKQTTINNIMIGM